MKLPDFAKKMFGGDPFKDMPTNQSGTTTKTYTKPDGSVVTVTQTVNGTPTDGTAPPPELAELQAQAEAMLQNTDGPETVTEEVITNPDGSVTKRTTSTRNISRSVSSKQTF